MKFSQIKNMGKIPQKNISISRQWLFVLISILLKSIALTTMHLPIRANAESILTLVIVLIVRFMPYILLLISLALLLEGKKQNHYLIGADIIVSIIFFIDSIYLRAFNDIPSIRYLSEIKLLDGLLGSIFTLFRVTDLIWFIDWPFLMGKGFRYPGRDNKINLKTLCLVLIFSTTFISLHMRDEGAFADRSLYLLGLSPLGFHMYDIASTVIDSNNDLSAAEEIAIERYLEKNYKSFPDGAQNTEYSEYYGLLKDKNLIVIQVESLENFLVGATYFGTEITPAINRLAADGIYFSNIVEQVKNGNSSDAEFMFNTSIYPPSSGSAFIRYPRNKYNTLTKLLKNEGYKTIAIHGDDKYFWNRAEAYPVMGFDEFIGEDMFKYKDEIGIGLSDEALFNESFDRTKELGKEGNPYFLYIITTTSHMPYDLPDNLKSIALPKGYADNTFSNYLQAIKYTDKQIGMFINKLEQQGLMKNTAIIIYGDHEGIHKYYPDQCKEVKENRKRIPFIIYCPESGIEGANIGNLGGQIDIYPTLAYLLGMGKDNYAHNVMGKNIFSKNDYALLADGRVLGNKDEEKQIKDSLTIADLIVKSDYFNGKNKKSNEQK